MPGSVAVSVECFSFIAGAHDSADLDDRGAAVEAKQISRDPPLPTMTVPLGSRRRGRNDRPEHQGSPPIEAMSLAREKCSAASHGTMRIVRCP